MSEVELARKAMAVAIAPKFTAFSSIVGSACIILLIVRHGRNQQLSTGSSRGGKSRLTTYHRLILGMSCTDLSASMAWFLTTWPIPADTPFVYGAMGTQQTCSAQAFFAQFSLSTVMYNTCLALYYYLVIVRGWKDEQLSRVEWGMHLYSLAWGLGTAIAGLSLGLFNQVGWDCWISASPLGCQESWNSPDGTTTCVRGDNGSLYQWAFYYAPLWAAILAVTVLMYCVYLGVHQQVKKMNKYRFGSDTASGNAATTSSSPTATTTSSQQDSRQRDLVWQAFAYVGAFFVAWIFPTIFQIYLVSSDKFPWPLLFLTAFFVPSQGLLNLIVFLRPKYVRYRRRSTNQDNGKPSFWLFAWFRFLGLELGCITPEADETLNNRTLTTNVSTAGPLGKRVQRDNTNRQTFRASFLKGMGNSRSMRSLMNSFESTRSSLRSEQLVTSHRRASVFGASKDSFNLKNVEEEEQLDPTQQVGSSIFSMKMFEESSDEEFLGVFYADSEESDIEDCFVDEDERRTKQSAENREHKKLPTNEEKIQKENAGFSDGLVEALDSDMEGGTPPLPSESLEVAQPLPENEDGFVDEPDAVAASASGGSATITAAKSNEKGLSENRGPANEDMVQEEIIACEKEEDPGTNVATAEHLDRLGEEAPMNNIQFAATHSEEDAQTCDSSDLDNSRHFRQPKKLTDIDDILYAVGELPVVLPGEYY